jgi:hypothetical protein
VEAALLVKVLVTAHLVALVVVAHMTAQQMLAAQELQDKVTMAQVATAEAK